MRPDVEAYVRSLPSDMQEGMRVISDTGRWNVKVQAVSPQGREVATANVPGEYRAEAMILAEAIGEVLGRIASPSVVASEASPSPWGPPSKKRRWWQIRSRK